jgi:hypothetical protein
MLLSELINSMDGTFDAGFKSRTELMPQSSLASLPATWRVVLAVKWHQVSPMPIGHTSGYVSSATSRPAMSALFYA